MARVLLSAYACEPGRGSEPEVGWSWATELARLGHRVTVITRTANCPAIESEAQLPSRQLQFVYYDLPAWALRCRKFRFTKLLYYIAWQWFAAQHVRQLFPSLPFDLVHHVTFVCARHPSFMGSLGIPFWFGPVSGGETVPALLRPGCSAGERWHEWLRGVSNCLLRMDPLMRRTFRQARRILVTRDTIALLPRRCRQKTAIQLGIGLRSPAGSVPSLSKPRSPAARLLYVGRLLEWKGVDIALLALEEMRRTLPDARLTIAGGGPARSRLERLARKLGLDDIVAWIGWLPHKTLSEQYCAADLLIFPSLRDSGGMVVLEALAHRLPVVCTDLGGPGVIVDSTCGRVLTTQGRSRSQLAHELAATLVELFSVPDRIRSLSHGAHVRAQQFKFADLVRSVYAGVPVDGMVQRG